MTTTAVLDRARERVRQLAGGLWDAAGIAWRDARRWPMGAGALVLAAALVAAAGAVAVGAAESTGRTGLGLVAPMLTRWPSAAVALACVAVPGAAIAWGFGALTGVTISQRQPRRERPYVARRWRRLITGFCWFLVGLVLWMVGGWSLGALLGWLVLVVLGAAVTAAPRARARALRYLLAGLATPRADSARTPEDNGWHVTASEWDGRHLLSATVAYPAELRAHVESVRSGVESAVGWTLTHRGVYGVTWNAAAGERSFTIAELPNDPLPDYFEDRPWPDELPGSVLGISTPLDSTARVDWGDDYGDTSPIPVLTYTFNSQRHMLITGGTGGGKTELMRGIVVRSVRRREVKEWWIIDGKSGADYASLEGREGIRAVAYEPAEWDQVFREFIEIMQERYREAREYEAGRGPKPAEWPRLGLVIDEIQEVRTALGAQVFDQYMTTISRLVRAARMSLLAGTQRPDVSETLPGSARDQFLDRAVCGWLSKTGARMVLDDQWAVVTGNENEPPPDLPSGRAVVRIDNRIYRIQVPHLPSPVQEPRYESLYPPKMAPIAPPEPPAPTPPELPPGPADDDQEHDQDDRADTQETALPDNVRPFPKRTGGDASSAILASLATAGQAGRRRVELDEAAGTGAAVTRAHLDALIKAGHVVRSGSGMGTRYRLAWHVAGSPERVDQDDQTTDQDVTRAAAGDDTRRPQRRRGGRTD